MAHAFHEGEARLLQTIRDALQTMGENVKAEMGDVESDWDRKYKTLKKESDQKQRALQTRVGELLAEVSSLKDELLQARGHKSTPAPLETETLGDSAGGHPEPPGIVQDLRRSLDKSHAHCDSLREQLDRAVSIAQYRKERTSQWTKYANSLESKIKRLEQQAAERSAASAHLAQPTSTTSTTSMHGAAPGMPPTPATTEKPPPVRQEPARLLRVVSQSPDERNAIDQTPGDLCLGPPDRSFDSGDAHDSPLLPAQVVPDQIVPDPVVSVQLERKTSDHALDSTQGVPSSPSLPTPRATGATATGAIVASAPVAVKQEPLSDGLEILWGRPVNQSRSDNNDGGPAPGPASTPRPHPVHKAERETLQSTPYWSASRTIRDSQESIDLDEGQLAVVTPRKRQLLGRIASENYGRAKRDANEVIKSSQSSDYYDDVHTSSTHDAESPPSPTPHAPHPATTTNTPLVPISANIRRPTSEAGSVSRRLKRSIESLAEDDEDDASPDSTPKRPAVEAQPASEKASRLNSPPDGRPSRAVPLSPGAQKAQQVLSTPLPGGFGMPPPQRLLPRQLEGAGPSPRTPGTAPASTSKVGPAQRTPSSIDTWLAKARSKAATPATSATSATPLSVALQAAKAESAARKTASRLRGKPLEELKMDDFKINPATNNGELFAYTEVVRGRADRASLAGCNDPQCCGKVFRGMSTSELDAGGNALVGQTKSIDLMKRYLGDDAFKLASMGLDAKRALWIEARTRELTDKYGKHRHRYHRRASPPGYWDTDFPSTQEEQIIKAEEEKVERLTVQERYREAMRPGGRWLFRDE